MKKLFKAACIALSMSVAGLPVQALAQFEPDRYLGDTHHSLSGETSVSYSSPANAAGRLDYWNDRVTWRVNGGLEATNADDANHSLRLAQSEYRDLNETAKAASKDAKFKPQADAALKSAQKEIDKLYAKIAANDYTPKQNVATTTGSNSTANTATFTTTQVAVAGVIAAGAITAIAVGASGGSTGGSSSTSHH